MALPVVLLLVVGTGAFATPGAYTDPAAFAAAVPGGTATVDFEALAPGTVVSGTTQTPPGGGVGVVLPPPLADVLDPGGTALPLQVVADGGDNPASSGAHSLGVDDAGNFDALTAGTPLAFGFTGPVWAFGLTFVTPEEPDGALFDGDVHLSVPGEATAQLALGDATLLGTFGGREYRAYFLGVIGAAPFTSATLELGPSAPVSGFFLNIDDAVVPLPEPAIPSALAAGGALLALLGRRRAARKGTPCR